jgi:hypothetical protein
MSYYWCTDHQRVETDQNVCPGNRVLGPYRTESEARSAIERIRERERIKEEEDRRWHGN